MINKLSILFLILLSFSMAALDVEARRLGGGGNFGRQRSFDAQPAPRPSQQQAAPNSTPPGAGQPQSGASRWMGPLVGLVAGTALGALLMNNGSSGLLMLLVLFAAAVFVMRFLKRPQPQASRYASADYSASAANAMPVIGSNVGGLSSGFGRGGETPQPPRFPPGFDAHAFAQNAQVNFMRLQSANDQRDAALLQDFMTPSLYREIAADIASRGGQQTEISNLRAEVIDLITENNSYIASVRFNGMVREEAGGALQPFSEIWNLENAVDGSSGWLLSGIQQDEPAHV